MPHAFIIGYCPTDPLFYQMKSEHGMILAGRCGSCRRNTFLNPSGVDALRTRDCAVYCNECAHERGEYDHFISDLDL